jgi:hypothetical protein
LNGFSRHTEPPVIVDLHFHEGRNVEDLGKTKASPGRARVLVHSVMEHIAMFFTPRGVVNFRYNGFHTTIFPVITEVKAHRVEAVTEISKMGQESYRAAGTLTRLFFHQVPRGAVQGNEGIPEMVPSPEVGEIDFPA